MKEVIIKTQAQLNKIKADFDGYVYIEGGTDDNPLVLSKKFDNAYVISRGTARLILDNDAVLYQMWESSQVNVMWESSQVKEMRESSQVKEMWGSSQVNVMRESSQVKEMRESSQVNVMWESSQVNVMWGSSQVKEMRESSQVKEMWESSQVNVMWGSSQVNVMRGSSQVKDLYGEAMVSAHGMNKLVCHGYNIIRTHKSNKKNLTIILNKDSHLILIPDFKATFADFAKQYPVKFTKTKAILYKAVHKREGKYFSDYVSSFEYQIGKVYKEEADPKSAGSCARGLHLAHLSWAKAFGSNWNDMAILECETNIKDIIVAKDCDGKLRTNRLKVLREIEL